MDIGGKDVGGARMKRVGAVMFHLLVLVVFPVAGSICFNNSPHRRMARARGFQGACEGLSRARGVKAAISGFQVFLAAPTNRHYRQGGRTRGIRPVVE